MYVRVAVTGGVAIGISMSLSRQIDAVDTHMHCVTDSVVTPMFSKSGEYIRLLSLSLMQSLHLQTVHEGSMYDEDMH